MKCDCCGADRPESEIGRPRLMVGRNSKAAICRLCYMTWYDTGITDPKELAAEVNRIRQGSTAQGVKG